MREREGERERKMRGERKWPPKSFSIGNLGHRFDQTWIKRVTAAPLHHMTNDPTTQNNRKEDKNLQRHKNQAMLHAPGLKRKTTAVRESEQT
jgi:hypothetical protein